VTLAEITWTDLAVTGAFVVGTIVGAIATIMLTRILRAERNGKC
jgi:hypothetical protein